VGSFTPGRDDQMLHLRPAPKCLASIAFLGLANGFSEAALVCSVGRRAHGNQLGSVIESAHDYAAFERQRGSNLNSAIVNVSGNACSRATINIFILILTSQRASTGDDLMLAPAGNPATRKGRPSWFQPWRYQALCLRIPIAK
jgi:hypothetical protein